MDLLIKGWEEGGYDRVEITRRLIDLFFVAVLLDAGAGDVWKFTEPGTGNAIGRSEGIAVAALYMFKAGSFSSGTGTDIETVDGKSYTDGFHTSILTLDSLQARDLPISASTRFERISRSPLTMRLSETSQELVY